MVPHSTLRDAIRALGYQFKRETARVEVYKRRGGIERVVLRRTAAHSPEAAASILRQAGMAPDAIESFLAPYAAPDPHT